MAPRTSGAAAMASVSASASTRRAKPTSDGAQSLLNSSDESSDPDLPAPLPRRSSAAARRQSAANEGHRAGATSHQPPPALIPASLLTRICQENFQHPDTKLGKDARVLLSKYMDTFTREALARAKHEMDQTSSAGRTRDFLEVEDLERLAPQLLLDF